MTPSSSELEIPSAEQALFSGQVQCLIATFFQNERPPRGLIGRLDWYFQGAISTQLQNGAISGLPGECVYLPVKKNQATYHLLLLGCGEIKTPGQRLTVQPAQVQTLKKNLLSLKWKSVGISMEDFGAKTQNTLTSQLEGVPLWISR